MSSEPTQGCCSASANPPALVVSACLSLTTSFFVHAEVQNSTARVRGSMNRLFKMPCFLRYLAWFQAISASSGNALTRSMASAEEAVPRMTRPLIP
jgi:hypothetical protein